VPTVHYVFHGVRIQPVVVVVVATMVAVVVVVAAAAKAAAVALHISVEYQVVAQLPVYVLAMEQL
jgi:hypothetical protein